MKILTLCCLLVACSSCFSSMLQEVRALNNQNTPYSGVNTPVKQDEAGDDKATRLVRELQSDDEVERTRAKKGLRFLARESRPRVIHELVKLVQGSERKLRTTSRAHYDAWSFAAELLGKLKATEAVDVLIACIDCNNGMGGLSAHRFPAFRALIMIGSEAIPKLTEALSNTRPSTRSRAALALGEIGGSDAKKALEHALLSERHEDVVKSIQIALRNQ